MRKALTALAGHHGYRFRGGEGSHAHVVEFGRAALPPLGEDLWDQADELRRLRNVGEYGDIPSRQITPATVEAYEPVVDGVLAAVREALKRRPPPAKRDSRRR